MLQVRLNLQVNSFPNQVNNNYSFQPRSIIICFNPDQFVSTHANLSQPRSVCCNPGQFGAGTKHRSQVIVLPIQKVSSTFIKACLRPKQKFLGLMLAFING